jgi:hypothetical protein
MALLMCSTTCQKMVKRLFPTAAIVTGKISAVITECRCVVAKVRHERAAKECAEAAKRGQEQLETGKGGV